MDNLQPSAKGLLDLGVPFNDYMVVGSLSRELKIESGPSEMKPRNERSNQPGVRGVFVYTETGVQPYHRDNWLVAAKRS